MEHFFKYVPLCSILHQGFPMKDQLRREWAALMQEGAHGQATRFRLRAMRLAQLVRTTDPDLSAALTSGLVESSSLARLAPAPSAAGEAPDLLAIEELPALQGAPYWPKPVANQLERIVSEWRSQDALLQANLHPIKTVLLYGPPGVGKTLSARWLALQLQLPLATLDLAATMNSYLGKTGQNIAKALSYAKSNPCVLFLDEFDALGKRRSDDQDVGELKRVVNVLLQAVDQWTGPSLLVAATNHESLLDKAIVRRFEASIEFPPASSKQVGHVLRSLGVSANLALKLARRLQGQPISNATKLVMSARKRQVLDGISFESAIELAMSEQLKTKSHVERRRATVAALSETGKSAHQIAKELGISHTTALRDLKAATGE